MKYRPVYLVISSSLIFISIFSMLKWGFRMSSDFTGGSILEVKFGSDISENKIKEIFADQNIQLTSFYRENNLYSLKFKNIDTVQKTILDQKIKDVDSNSSEVRFETIGPVLGRELFQKTVVAIILSSLALLFFIGSKFKDLSFGASAVLAMLHDAFILVGAFSILGHFFGAEIDSLFVTALLTTLSASVHDTVVTFDRIRELRRKNFNQDWNELANQAVSEVIVRSINNSMTIIFMLLSLVLLGGAITRWFALALLIGVVCGTYSSIGVAIPLVLFWKNKKK